MNEYNKALTLVLFALSIAVIVLGIFSIQDDQRIKELRKDVNRVSNIQIKCSYAVQQGFYEPKMMFQCLEDYIDMQASKK